MELAKKQRGGCRAQVSNLAKNVQALWDSRSSATLDPLELQLFYDKSQRYDSQLTQLDSEIGTALIDATALEDEAVKVVQYKELIWDTQSKLSILIKKTTPDVTADPGLDSSLSTTAKANMTKLPKLTINSFDGDPLKWREFWDSFRHSIHENPDLTDVEKFQHLKSLLTNEARVVADGYRLTEANYNAVIEVLVDRFGSEELAVFAHFDKLLALPVSTTETHKLQSTYDETEKHIRSLVSLGLGEETFGQVFTPIILSKLPRPIRTNLHRRHGSNRWTLSALRELFRSEIRARQMGDWTLDQSSSAKPSSSNQFQSSKPFKPKFSNSTAGAPTNSGDRINRNWLGPRSCNFCGGNHRHAECTSVISLDERRNKLRGSCFKCLRRGHMPRNCDKVTKCFYCEASTHHSCLCLSKFGGSSKPNWKPSNVNKSSTSQSKAANLTIATQESTVISSVPNDQQSTPTSISSLSNSTTKKRFVQMQMASVVLKTTSERISARLFFDTGSSRSYITSSLANRLNLSPSGSELISNGRFEDTQRRTHSYPVVQLSLPSSTGPIPLELLVTDTIACPITRLPLDQNRYPLLGAIPLADSPATRPENVHIDVLVGSDYYYHIIQPERIDLEGGLILLGSKLGYIVTGNVHFEDQDASSDPSCLSALHISSNSSVSYQSFDLEKFWKLEDIGGKDDSYQKDDELALQRFNDSIQFSDDRYEVGWPWKTEYPELPTNYNLAYGRLKSLVKRLQNDPGVLSVYNSTILDQLHRCIIEEVAEIPSSNTRIHYLPHHCIIKPDRSTTKLRIVYDGSSKAHRSLNSLNDCLLRGPVFLQNLCGLLLRFRIHNIAVTADIEKAFLQVSLRKEDRDVTRFLWVKDTGKPVSHNNVVIYRFCRVLFGIISSPFLLDATIKHFLRQQSSKIAARIVDNMYVDNIACGASTPLEATELYKGTKQLFSQLGMNIRDWFSNSEDLINCIPTVDRGKVNKTKVLGMQWNTKTDELSCSTVQLDPSSIVTKRHLLQAISKLFDPCGLFSPVLIQGKILVQELWKRNIKWDEKLPDDIIERWQTVSHCLESVSLSSIPRFVGDSPSKEWLIHCFCDASAKAYASVVYLKTSTLGSKPVLVFSKTKLAPTKPVSIPRLELMAVVIGCRISKFVMDHIGLNITAVTVWSDSKCVLQWLNSTKVLSVFVENRIRELRNYNYKFLHISTSLNPADLCSRGCTFQELQKSQLWWSGPPFLQSPETVPFSADLSIVELSEAVDVLPVGTAQTVATQDTTLNLSSLIVLKNFSSLNSLIRITAWVLRFCWRLLSGIRQITRSSGPQALPSFLSSKDLARARFYWIRQVQGETLSPTQKSPILSRQFRQLGVYVDDDGIYRSAGRIHHANVIDRTKFPCLLPKRSHFTYLVVMDIHVNNLHSGILHTLSLVRRNYWIPSGRSVVKSVIRTCLICRRQEGGTFKLPSFPPLPEFRVTANQPFHSVGVDYMGPMYVKEETVTSKVWLCLFTCAASRAIHLELVTNLSTNQFLMALRRFIARYGTPHIIISDNAKQFKLARDFLDRLWTDIVTSDQVQNFSSNQGIQWIFVPEYAPWMGGFYERLVGTVKRSLKKILGRATLDLIQLQTVVAEAISVVNTRPLVASDDIADPILTPADLIFKSQPLSGDREKPANFLDFDPLSEPDETVHFGPANTGQLMLLWKSNRKLADQFWQVWKSDYLTNLRVMASKFKTRGHSDIEPKTGTVVIIRSNLPRSRWSLGRIVVVRPSSDGLVRSATVRLSTGRTVIRPLKLLYPIESSISSLPNKSTESASSHQIPPDASIAHRPQRQAASAAKGKIREQLSAFRATADPLTVPYCFSGFIESMPAVNVTINSASPLSRHYSRHNFYVGTERVTSIEMGVWYIVLAYHNFHDVASHLVDHHGLRVNAAGIAAWLEQVEFRRSGDVNCILQIDRIYHEVMRLLLQSPNSEFLTEFRRYRGMHGQQRINFIFCAKKEFIYSCGVSRNFPAINDPGSWPGFNVYGDMLTSVYDLWAFGDDVRTPTADQILTGSASFGSRYERAALVLSDSQSRHLRSIEYSVIVRKSGGTFWHLAISLRSCLLRNTKFIIIVAGTNMTSSKWNPVKWEEDWQPLLRILTPVIGNLDVQVLLNGPIWNPDRRAVKVVEFSEWLSSTVDGMINVTFFDWSNPEGNPFVITSANGSRYPNPKFFDSDRYHVNSKGYLLFWRRWCYTHSGLKILSIKQTTHSWQLLDQPHTCHTTNNFIQV